MLSVAGADHIITMDLHASQIQVLGMDSLHNLKTASTNQFSCVLHDSVGHLW